MSGMRRFALLALAGLVLATLTGCPATEHRAEPTPTPSAASASASGQQPGPAPATRALLLGSCHGTPMLWLLGG